MYPDLEHNCAAGKSKDLLFFVDPWDSYRCSSFPIKETSKISYHASVTKKSSLKILSPSV